MAKTPSKASTDKVPVRLKCFYSGFPNDPGPGDVVQVDRTEADRLISVGAADAVTE
jgi:hypothetical protein